MVAEKGMGRNKVTDAHQIDSNTVNEPVVEAEAFDASSFDLNLTDVHETRLIKIGVDTGPRKTARPQESCMREASLRR